MDKSTYFFGGLAVLVLVGIGVGISQGWINPKPEETEQPQPSNTPPETGYVKRILDPITFELESGHIIRYIGVRTPTVSEEVQCFGKEALLANESIIGKQVRLEEEPLLLRSSDGAFTRYVWMIEGDIDPSPSPTPTPSEDSASEVDDEIAPDISELTENVTEIIDEEIPLPTPDAPTEESESSEPTPEPTPEDPKDIFVNERILEGGFGFPVVSEDMKYGERMLSAARFASATSKGLWGQCEISEEEGLSTKPLTDCTIKGKVSLNGDKLYRTQECAGYPQTMVIQNDGGQWFCAPDLAEDAGFTKAPDCP